MKKSVASKSLFAIENSGISERNRQLIFSKVMSWRMGLASLHS